ncbi:uncharacterized protein LACBIDRAFT_332048 [Laccaria bicolor S238N-H82]|uniref:Predicted protein n=1 Tax=Laccaria bicolor (strain S238N-H82 / ATCC MYA-4686) TaxID=486041 RepID=B0DRE7_LACBS|nr:uncharacterized protein LACBIDRAFT_332048 [Laccaria bicolor S238N-H82]EDR02858.1 predicted protein [Laccaria bicolor S238N-H82]|eukprot:XP_001886568.1 predicted protein [Laccaria bicolor S238N-H82]
MHKPKKAQDNLASPTPLAENWVPDSSDEVEVMAAAKPRVSKVYTIMESFSSINIPKASHRDVDWVKNIQDLPWKVYTIMEFNSNYVRYLSFIEDYADKLRKVIYLQGSLPDDSITTQLHI